MRKNIMCLLTVLSLAVLLSGCNQPKQSVVGVVDTSRVYQESEAGKAGVKYLESLQAKMQNDLSTMQEKLQKNPTEETTKEFQTLYSSFQQQLSTEQQRIILKLNDSLQAVLDAYRTEKGLEVIVGTESVLSVSPEADVTNDIIVEMNKRSIAFEKPVTPETPAVEAPAVAEPATEKAVSNEAATEAPAAK